MNPSDLPKAPDSSISHISNVDDLSSFDADSVPEKYIEYNAEEEISLSKNIEDDKIMDPFPNQFLNMQNLSDITLPGYVIKLLAIKNRLTFEEVVIEVSKVYPTLRRSDGSKYTGNIDKTVRACLTTLDAFKEVDGIYWTIRQEQAQMYQEKTTEKLKNILSQKKKNKIGIEGNINPQGNEISEGQNEKKAEKLKPKRRYKRKCEKYEQIYNLLDDCSKVIKSDTKTKYLLDNPFKRVKGNETSQSLWKKLGPERMMGIVQCFEFFSPVIHEYIKKKQYDKKPGTSKTNNKIELKKK